MASSLQLPSLQLHKSNFLGQTHHFHQKLTLPIPKLPSTFHATPTAKFNLYEFLGGRGLCNGEQGLQQELEKDDKIPQKITSENQEKQTSLKQDEGFDEDAFEKEMSGLTGGFPGGEKGLRKFIEQNPPPAKKPEPKATGLEGGLVKKAKPPELPLLLPGMIAIVKNPNNPFYMYCGIVQRITDGKAGVIFEGGNWDRLVTFRLDELERRDKGPPMVNPKSVVLEATVEETAQARNVVYMRTYPA